MKNILTIAAAAAVLSLGATAAQAESRQERNEARLAERLEGRTAGTPESCVTVMRSSDIEVIPYVGIVYDAGDTIWVARATNPNMLRTGDVPIFDRWSSSRLCNNDAMRTVDRYAQNINGSLFLEDFVPYTRADG